MNRGSRGRGSKAWAKFNFKGEKYFFLGKGCQGPDLGSAPRDTNISEKLVYSILLIT
jgi:hypothetical protein